MKNLIKYQWLMVLLMACSNHLISQCDFTSVVLVSPANDYGNNDVDEVTAWMTIQASNTIGSGAKVIYAADESIRLDDGFFAESGSDFLARIGCIVTTIEPSFSNYLSIHPNPVQHELVIKYALEEKQMMSVTLLNAVGQPVRTLLHGISQSAGEYSYSWKLHDLPVGMYLVYFNISGSQHTRRIVKAE